MKRLLAAVFVLLASFAVQAQNLSVSPSTVTAGQSVTASWDGIGSPAATDWIGLYPSGAADNAFAAWIYTNGSAAGSVSLGVPVNLASGSYELRLFANNGYTRLATSGALTVNAAPAVTLSGSPTSLVAGSVVSASWANIYNPTATDWVGLYVPGAANNAFIAWVFTSGSASGSVNLTVPVNLAAGTYELRLFPNNSFTLLATSGAITVTAPPAVTVSASPSTIQSGNSLTASWTNIYAPSATDWVGLYTPGAADNAFVAWFYTTGTASGNTSLAVPIPTPAGTYQLRLFTNNSFTRLATSGAVTVTAPPPVTLSASPASVAAGGSVTAAWTNIVTPTGTDWIGLYAPGAVDTAFISWRYTTGTAGGNVPFSIGAGVANGAYGLRLFAANGFTRLATSSTLSVGQANLYFIHPDHLGTPRLVADDAGTTVWKWDQQEPFGNDVPNQDPGNTGSVFEMPLRFSGQYADKETGLAHNYFRDYDPAIGGYKQSDPIGLRGGMNTYAYVGGAPTDSRDPYGLWSTRAHHYFIDQVFANLPVDARQQIKLGSDMTDAFRNQLFQSDNRRHAMGAGDIEKARKEYCEFVDQNMKTFSQMQRSTNRSIRRHAYKYLGAAMHAVMDSTSPVHADFQDWHFRDFYLHGNWPDSREDIDVAQRHFGLTWSRMSEVYGGAKGSLCGCP